MGPGHWYEVLCLQWKWPWTASLLRGDDHSEEKPCHCWGWGWQWACQVCYPSLINLDLLSWENCIFLLSTLAWLAHRETWYPTYRRHFLRGALARCYDCRRGYWMYQQVSNRGLLLSSHVTICAARVLRQSWSVGMWFSSGESSRCSRFNSYFNFNFQILCCPSGRSMHYES